MPVRNLRDPQTISGRHRPVTRRSRPPYWLPAQGYYVLATAVALAAFFVLWGVMDGESESPWIGAGLAASVVLGSAVIFRELVLRAARGRHYREQQRLERNLRMVPKRPRAEREKLTLEQNQAALGMIAQRSDAAKVLPRVAAAHREVCDLCEDYLRTMDREIPRVSPGSPRLEAFKKGVRSVRRYHRYHLTRWAEIEVRKHTLEAHSRDKISDRMESARRAAGVIDQALIYYPREATFLESLSVIDEIIDTLTVTGLIEQAEAAAASGDMPASAGHYREALALIELKGGAGGPKGETAAEVRAAMLALDAGRKEIIYAENDDN